MKKKILAALAAVSMVTALVPVTSAFAAETVTVKIHYDNPDAANWAVWGWATGLDGAWYSFDNGVAEFTTPDIASTWFIVTEYDENSESGWGATREDSEEKPYNADIKMGGDRSIDATKVVDGVVDVYVAMGSKVNTYDEGGDPTPADSTEDPAESTEEPAESTETPAESTETPAESTETPADSTAAPADSTATSTPSSSNGNAPTGVEGIAIGVVAVAAAGAVVLAKKSKK